ncbi:MAG: SDR family oxidoreductase, partial [Actinomycetota bacterium]|nr:SDR family oxidoreductase [Actinomycetota bacterium]
MDVTFDFTAKHVLVTGGTSGIGLGIATAFRDAGAEVTVTGTRAAIADYDVDLAGLSYRPCRMTETETIDAVVAELEGCDVLVNNAGQNLPGGRSEWDPDVFEEVVAVNLFGAFRLATACKPLLVAAKGNVVNLGSMTSYFGLEIVPGYGAAKAGVVQMTKTLAVAWARDGVRVNAVAPGVIESGMTAPMLPYEQLTQPILDRTPMRRFGTPEDVAPAVLFLASSAARYVTGQTLAVDGGFSVQG